MLLNWGLEMADREGLAAYLEATSDGKPLYERHGFVTVREINLLDGLVTCTGMKRMPRTQ